MAESNTRKINIKYIAPVVTLVVVIIIGLAYWFIFQPMVWQTSRDGGLDLSAKERELQVLENYFSSQETFLENYQSVKDKEKIVKILPSERNIPSLLNELEALAEDSGFAPMFMEISSSLDISGNTATASRVVRRPLILDQDASLNHLEGIEQFNINFKITEGDYSDLKKFLLSIEDNLRIIDVISIRYHNKIKSYDLSLRTYYLAEEKI